MYAILKEVIGDTHLYPNYIILYYIHPAPRGQIKE